MGNLDYYKPVMAMLGLQFTYAGLSLLTRTALLEGMSPRVFVVYRQAIAALLTAPVAYSEQICIHSTETNFGPNLTYTQIVTINQNIYFEGLYLASTSMAGAMSNLLPAITFITAAFLGMLGAVGVIAGLHTVLWGKAKDIQKEINVEADPKSQRDQTQEVKILVDEALSCKLDLVEPFWLTNQQKYMMTRQINDC